MTCFCRACLTCDNKWRIYPPHMRWTKPQKWVHILNHGFWCPLNCWSQANKTVCRWISSTSLPYRFSPCVPLRITHYGLVLLSGAWLFGDGKDSKSLLTSLSRASRVSVVRASSPSCVCRLLIVWVSSSSFLLLFAACLLYSSTRQPPPMRKMMASPTSSAPSSAADSSLSGLMAEPRKPIILIFVFISIQWYALQR